jgi:hypothetical protein
MRHDHRDGSVPSSLSNRTADFFVRAPTIQDEVNESCSHVLFFQAWRLAIGDLFVSAMAVQIVTDMFSIFLCTADFWPLAVPLHPSHDGKTPPSFKK